MKEITIKDCRYGEQYLKAISNDDYYYDYTIELMRNGSIGENRGESIVEGQNRLASVWLLGLEDSGLLLQINETPILLVKCDDICNRIRSKVKDNIKKWNINYYESDYTDEKILTGLLDEKFLYTHKRSDGCFDKIVRYPQFLIENAYADLREMCKVVKVNLDKISIDSLKLKFKNLEACKKIKQSFDGVGHSAFNVFFGMIENALKDIDKLIDFK